MKNVIALAVAVAAVGLLGGCNCFDSCNPCEPVCEAPCVPEPVYRSPCCPAPSGTVTGSWGGAPAYGGGYGMPQGGPVAPYGGGYSAPTPAGPPPTVGGSTGSCGGCR
jgi:hypothetical protein